MTNYQPTFIRGKERGDYQRDCAPRYLAIRSYLDKHYQRPYSLFDLGANYGYFGLRFAFERDAVSVLVDTKPIAGILERNAPIRAMWLNKRMGSGDLQRLSWCESFDVVLALNVVHHIPDWKNAVDSLLNLGERVIFELPGEGDVGTANYSICDELREYVLSFPHEKIFEMPSHVSGVIRPTVVVEGKNTITKQTIDADVRGCAPVNVEIVSKPDMKYLKIEHKRTTEGRSFIHGMNLWNFRLLNGKYPTKVDKMVEKAVKEMDRFHDDLRPWNFILDGEKVHPIDFEDKLWRKTPEKEALTKCLSLLKADVDYSNPEFSRLLRTV